jgi:hypothetical protein
LRGEVTIVVAGSGIPRDEMAGQGDLEPARSRVDRLVAAGASRARAAKQVAAETGLPRRDLFREEG